MTSESSPVVEIGFAASSSTGWGLIALHVALGLARQGCRVHLPRESDLSGVSPALLPTLVPMLEPGDVAELRVRIDAYGNHWPRFQPIPNRTRVLFCVFEDTAIPETAVPELQRYDLILAPSTWARDILQAKGVASTVWHQGYDETLFAPAPRQRPAGPVYVFSGGKLEFRKGQDIVVEAFRRFRETPEGTNAILVTAWQNRWPQTMEGIWASGYVKGVPVIRNGLLDIQAWLEANGIPRSAVIDLGFPSQAELAQAIRECDVALFPNRCEGATNMMLPEVLGCQVAAIASHSAGHRDAYATALLTRQAPVTLPCSLYRGVEGWGESDPSECVEALLDVLDGLRRGRFRLEYDGPNRSVVRRFAWSSQTAALHHLITSLS